MMSVAFRRESDEEHNEPKFELPLPPGPNLVTPRGLALIEAKVSELEASIAANAADPEPEPGVVGFGTRVTFLLNGRERRIDIVGDDEADPASNRLAFSAPLSQALMGGEAGDLLDFNGKAEAIEIVAIEAI
jgi:transcription elongation GreA/GreB family factor